MVGPYVKDCNCFCGCDISPKTLKAFDKADGTLRWQHWLDNPVLASDGATIYGYAYEEDDSPEAMACTMVRLAGTGTPAPLGIAATMATRYKKWVRKIDSDGAVLGDSVFFWYTGNSGYTDTPIELPDPSDYRGAWMPDMYAASVDGGLLQVEGDYSLGTTLGDYLIAWDDNNVTTTRRYTFVGAAVRDNATPPVGGAKMRFIAAYDGTNAEQTIDVGSMIGKTAADLATALEAFPHIVSATGTGGPYPLVNIDLAIEWAQNVTHFKSVQRQTSTCRGVMTWVRDWDTAEITATLSNGSPTNSKASLWQFDDNDNIIGIGTNPLTSIGSPAEVGIAVEQFTLSGGFYTQAWRVRPTSSRPPFWGPTSGADKEIFYTRPAIRNGTMIVGHYPGTGNDQAVGEHSEWHEISLSSGALTSNGSHNNRHIGRPFFASDTKLVAAGWDSFISGDPLDGVATGYYQCERTSPNFISLMTGISGTATDWFGPYGAWPGGNVGSDAISRGLCAADTTAIYNPRKRIAWPASGGGWNNDAQSVLFNTDQRILTIETRSVVGAISRVAPDGYFSLANYYRIRHFFASPINIRWNSTGMEWRVAFHTNDNVTASSSLYPYTDWLPFNADETDLQTALAALVGSNDDGPNAFVEGPYYPVTADEPIPVMVWQRGLEIVFPAENAPVTYNLNDRGVVRYCRIQVRAATANGHQVPEWQVCRMNWSTGDIVWDVPFGTSIVGGEIAGNAGILLGDNYVVSGNRVRGGCLCTYRWETGYFGPPEWMLIFADCGTKTATPPATDGTFLGEVREGTCE